MAMMDDQELSQWILRRLGAPMLKVELTQEHLNDSIEFAKRWYAAKKGAIKTVQVNYPGNVNEFVLDRYRFDPANGKYLGDAQANDFLPWAPSVPYAVGDLVKATVRAAEATYICNVAHQSDTAFNPVAKKGTEPVWREAVPEIDTVTDVVFTSAKIDMSILAGPFILPDQQIPYNVFGTGASGGLYSNYIQVMQHIEMAKRALGAEQDWRQDGRSLFIFPVPPNAGALFLTYMSHDFNLVQVNERDADLVKRYALARTKLDLGRVRSKYGENPTAQGSTSLDGERLLEEGNTEIEALDEEISQSGYPMGFIIG